MDTKDLVFIFRRAKDAALRVSVANPNDDGTCNMDTPTIFFPRGTKEAKIVEAATSADIRVHKFKWLRQTAYWIMTPMHGQGSLRTRMAEAAVKSFKESGLDATVYYQVD